MSDDEVVEIVKAVPEVICIDSDISEPEVKETIDITSNKRKHSKQTKRSRSWKKNESTQLPLFIPMFKNHGGMKSKRKRHKRRKRRNFEENRISKLSKYMKNPIDTITGCQVHDTEIESNVFIMNRNKPRIGLRPVIIDAASIATSNGTFSMSQLWKSISYFKDKGHKNIVAFLMPYHEFPSSQEERRILDELRTMNYVFSIPLKRIDNHVVDISMAIHLLQYAAAVGGVLISNRIFREEEYCNNPNWRNVLNRRLLNVVWMNGTFMIPEYPFNLGGPKLNEVLSFPTCTCS